MKMKMNKLERRARRALYWANEFRRDNDTDGEAWAMARYRDIQRKLERSMSKLGYVHA